MNCRNSVLFGKLEKCVWLVRHELNASFRHNNNKVPRSQNQEKKEVSVKPHFLSNHCGPGWCVLHTVAFKMGKTHKHEKHKNSKSFREETEVSDHRSKQKAKGRKEKHGRMYSAREEKELNSSLLQMGYIIFPIKGDGNCMFRSISDQISQNDDLHASIRDRVMNFIQRHAAYFEPYYFVEEDQEPETFSQYIKRMKNDGEWGSNVELVAASKCLNVNIVIHQHDVPTFVIQANDGGELSHAVETSKLEARAKPKPKPKPAVKTRGGKPGKSTGTAAVSAGIVEDPKESSDADERSHKDDDDGGGGGGDDDCSLPRRPAKDIHLSFHGGCHYNSVRRLDGKATSTYSTLPLPLPLPLPPPPVAVAVAVAAQVAAQVPALGNGNECVSKRKGAKAARALVRGCGANECGRREAGGHVPVAGSKNARKEDDEECEDGVEEEEEEEGDEKEKRTDIASGMAALSVECTGAAAAGGEVGDSSVVHASAPAPTPTPNPSVTTTIAGTAAAATTAALSLPPPPPPPPLQSQSPPPRPHHQRPMSKKEQRQRERQRLQQLKVATDRGLPPPPPALVAGAGAGAEEDAHDDIYGRCSGSGEGGGMTRRDKRIEGGSSEEAMAALHRVILI
jgi:hypothetical protein